MAVGLETFMREWYQLFPRNPYARLAALIPISLIALGMVSIAASRYFYGFYYTDTSTTFHPELSAVRQTVKPQVKTQLVVPPEQVAFYDILRSKYPQLSVSSPDSATNSTGEQIVLASAGGSTEETPRKIVASYFRDHDVLLRVYTH